MGGKAFGDRPSRAIPQLSWFIKDDGGYSSVFVAVALLVAVSLVFALASTKWLSSKSADVQNVADASALAATNVVAAYSTVAQVLDACVLSMGLFGALVYSAGMVVAAIPFIQSSAPPILEFGRKVFDARRQFAKSAASGLEKFESTLPALIVLNAASAASANSGSASYLGIAIPYPTESKSSFGSLESDVSTDEMDKAAEELRQASAEKEEAEKRMREAKERAWRADNVDNPKSMWERANSLTSLTSAQNPHYSDVSTWKFSFAWMRTKNYYASRTHENAPSGADVDSLQRAAARTQFWGYAYEIMSKATIIETDDECVLEFPEIPHTTAQIIPTRLYSDAVWPITRESEGDTLHFGLNCPGAKGAHLAYGSLSGIDRGIYRRCPYCKMDAQAMGNVADASTNINNGYEYYYKIVREEASKYQAAFADAKRAEQKMKDAAEKNKDAFDKAIELLAVNKMSLCPPGAYGCISFVLRGEQEVPSDLTQAFLEPRTLPKGAAIAGATLAPDNDTDGHNVLASVFDSFSQQGTPDYSFSIVDGIAELWGKLLVGYGSAYGSVSDVASKLLDGISFVLGEDVANWLKDKIVSIIDAAGFEPADMRLRKPVLVNSQDILSRAGINKTAQVREFLLDLRGTPEEIRKRCYQEIWDLYGQKRITIAEIPIPGLDGVSIPLEIDLDKIVEVLLQ